MALVPSFHGSTSPLFSRHAESIKSVQARPSMVGTGWMSRDTRWRKTRWPTRHALTGLKVTLRTRQPAIELQNGSRHPSRLDLRLAVACGPAAAFGGTASASRVTRQMTAQPTRGVGFSSDSPDQVATRTDSQRVSCSSCNHAAHAYNVAHRRLAKAPGR